MRKRLTQQAGAGRKEECPAGLIALEVLRIPMRSWWVFGDLNPGLSDYESAALTD